ncbi:MAG: helix-turn-helix domain-containing protein [Syntrophomonadaceae bacterium]
MEFGKKLKEERERQGYSLEAVEEETKIRKVYIKALEDEEFSLLPPRVYAVGFLKLYANFLKLNAEEMVEEFKSMAYSDEEEEHAVGTASIPEERGIQWPRIFNLKRIIPAAVFLVLAIWVGNLLVDNFNHQAENEPISPRPQQTETQSPVDKTAPPSQAKVDKPLQAAVLIEATQECWLRVAVDEQQQYEGTLLPGQTKSFTGKESVVINAGNAGGINITFNDNKLGPLGSPGEVVEKEFSIENPDTEME